MCKISYFGNITSWEKYMGPCLRKGDIYLQKIHLFNYDCDEIFFPLYV